MPEHDKIKAVADSFVPGPENPRALRDALGRFATGVTIVTARDADGAGVGITVNSFASVSLDPPLVLWSVAKSSNRHDLFAAADAFAIHVLGADQAGLCARFARQGAGFDGLAHGIGAAGVPLIAEALVVFECETEAHHPGGDHTILIGRVTRVILGADRAPLVFSQGAFGRFVAG
ncbi:flavin oxidoreductase [Rhodobacter veldkampii DSM 11550]|uniref:Flavin oxidoreductase n=1 Tax=Phaeovulum veldkampii DSM 11550 TaxID=1185920 RepID=A0A2T4JL57_9RHOB|nr:flavin reductase family protein [Phaeovulum veldkampii]MBK5947044.1 flavin oxidoreductase [Phaeovulum veldkampii DSM 11550]PTE18660.1 flavin oxidoreductase [Phaeovulum veldkampii DSM 11550]TDQ57291.1 flavin reductase (DIM6/NTAB) family NADH-FMN oxidoreductase RutF [Phaeovulum veldkampii DSM 11550]